MVQESKPKIAIIGGGPAGCVCAYFLQDLFDITVFDKNLPLKTLLPTGGGRCNLAPSKFDLKTLAHNYPRGEKFLYSIFSKFGVSETLEFFKKIGVETYTQPDGRIFPISDSSSDVRKKILNALNVNFITDNICKIDGHFKLYGKKNVYQFDTVVIATGGHSSFEILKNLGHNIIPPKPSLIGLKTDKVFTSGITLKNITAKFGKKVITDDLLFTHRGISGPLAYKISSINAREDFPYEIILDFIGKDIDLQELFNKNPHKNLKNLLSDFIPKAIISTLTEYSDIECCKINSKMRENILKNLREFHLKITGTASGSETVTAGGVDLDEINSKTMMSKVVQNLYFCGEVINVDGFCGGYNLQNCWSTAFVAAEGIINSYRNNV